VRLKKKGEKKMETQVEKYTEYTKSKENRDRVAMHLYGKSYDALENHFFKVRVNHVLSKEFEDFQATKY